MEIEKLAPGAVAEAVDLVNRVYAVAEEGLWLDGAARTSLASARELALGGELFVARFRPDGRIVGCVRVQRLDGSVGEFGMLAASPDHRGAGIGRRLVSFAEQLSMERGLDTMQLELLVPQTWKHPSKEFLHNWYTRIGYRVVRTGSLEEQYPELAPSIATPCDFVIYQKKLCL